MIQHTHLTRYWPAFPTDLLLRPPMRSPGRAVLPARAST